MKFFRNTIKTLFPKTYIKFCIMSCRKKFEKIPLGTENFNYELLDYEEWLREIEDKELIKKAEKMDVYIDEIPFPENDPENLYSIENSHYYHGTFGSKMLADDIRKTLIKKIRERTPSYKKERREIWEFWIKSIISVLGVLIGFVAILTKTKGCL